ncbi:hypothetical protein ABZV58_34370 [Nocardia sp. NPDC004654]|uniref:hypothetical protein n=1 Tax=Nocardia sp. NPDC004654 TaxID=3154776 RepID=UPI0033BACF58
MTESFMLQRARDEEFVRAEQLRRVSLFVELNLDSDDIERARELFEWLIHNRRRAQGAEWIVAKFPALTLTTLIGHAGVAYDRNRYWDSFWEELDLPRDLDFENLLRGKFGDLLRKFGLRRFEELGNQYVQVMAVHAGMPVHCLGDLVDVIEQHIAHGRPPRGAAVFEWLTEPGMGYRLNQLDVPVRNFLRLGGEVAVDIVDRIIEFAEYFREHPEAANDLDLGTATTGLPNLLLDALIDRLQERPLTAEPSRSNTAAHIQQPAVAYSRLDEQIVVEIPYPAIGAETPWLVSFDGDARRVYAERAWGALDGEVQPVTPVVVPRPVRRIMLNHSASGIAHRLSLVDTDDPLLLFDDRGKLLSRHAALPRAGVIAVCPHDAELVNAYDGAPVRMARESVPVGWRDWRAREYDLTAVDNVRWRRGAKSGPVRQVRALGAAVLDLAEPVEGVTTRSGLSVYAERPSVVLPASAEPTVWRVRTRRSGTVDWLTDDEWESGSEPAELDPFDGAEPGLLGRFDVVISGPLGSDLRHSLFLAEGLTVRCDSEFRVPSDGGLAPCVLELAAVDPLTVDRSRVEFNSATSEMEIRLASAGRTERLLLRPAHIEIRVDGIGATPQWRSSPALLTTDQVAEFATVSVRVPGDVRVDVALTNRSGTVVQIETPEVHRGNVFRVPTRAFLDTVRKVGVATMLARIDTADDATHEVAVARIRPPLLCAGARVEGDHLVFDGANGTDLAALVWADTAPWRAPQHLAIENGRAQLPYELIAAGPLTVQVFVDDPWSVTAAPERPGDDALHVDQPGWVADEHDRRTELSRFLAGHGPAPAGSAALPEIWAVLADKPAAEPIRTALHRALADDARSALETLADSMIPQHAHPALLISTGLMERDFSSVFRDTVPTNPWIGCLVDLADLAVVARTPESPAYQELAGRLSGLGGQRLRELLSGKAGDLREGIFDASAVQLHAMTSERVRMLRSACEIVPGALLDTDTRTSAMFEAFAQRHTWQRDPARHELTTGSAALLRTLRRASRLVYDQVAARNEQLSGVDTTALPWMLMSMQSLLLAAVARLTARGRIPSSPISDATRVAWARLAELCPGMVAADVLVADALACHDLHPDLIGEPL